MDLSLWQTDIHFVLQNYHLWNGVSPEWRLHGAFRIKDGDMIQRLFGLFPTIVNYSSEARVLDLALGSAQSYNAFRAIAVAHLEPLLDEVDGFIRYDLFNMFVIYIWGKFHVFHYFPCYTSHTRLGLKATPYPSFT